MIKEITEVFDKYQRLSKVSDYVSTREVASDIYSLILEARLKRIPKDQR